VVWRARYFFIGGIAIFIAVGLFGWHVCGGRGNGLKPDGGPVVTWLTTTRRSARSICRLLVTAVSTALAHTQCEAGRH